MAGRTFCNVLLGLYVTALAAPVCPPNGNKYEAKEIDFDEWEIWPLSGGVASGVEVTLKATKIEGAATIHFVTAQYEVLASYTLDTGAKKVWRTSCKPDLSDQSDYGGWPFEEGDSAFELTFHNSRPMLEDAAKNDVWAISYERNRMPWFDFTAATDAMAVYAMVSKGFVDGEIVDRRMECSTTCHPQECTGEDDKVVECEGGCKSRTPTLDGLKVSACSADAPSGNGVFCCEGRQLRHIAKDDVDKYAGKYVRVHDSAAAVRIACLSFLAGAERAVECKDTASYKVKVHDVDPYDTTDNTVSVLVPQLFAKGADHRVKIPVEVLDVSPIRLKTIKRTRAEDETWGIKVEHGEHFQGLISEVTDANEVDFADYRWWYVNMVNIGCKAYLHNVTANCKENKNNAWWVSYNEFMEVRDYEFKMQTIGLDYWVTDEPRDHTECSDDPDWKDAGDSDGLEATCENYQEYDYCSDFGKALPNFTARSFKHRPDLPFKNLISAAPHKGWSAAFTCCTCGGGVHDPPPADKASLRSVVIE